jgi:hypothetical protein
VYRITVYPEPAEQIAALPDEALAAYLEVLAVLELMPWNGHPQNDDNPEGAVRRWAFGPGKAGHVVYLVLEEQQEVHVVLVQWFG